MTADSFTFPSQDGLDIFVYAWLPRDAAPRAVVQIAHGMAEHAGRYGRLAAALNEAGFTVYANDHRGHGRSVRQPADLGHLADRDGWTLALADLDRLNTLIRQRHPGLPVVLLGHSMGSFMAQRYMIEHGDRIAAVVLSASNGPIGPLRPIGVQVARLERLRLGRRGRSGLIHSMSFGSFNKGFRPVRTECDWLSRDAAEVDKYVADPLCGFVCSVQTWFDFLNGLGENEKADNLARIPKDLPVYVLAGSDDPVSARTAGLQRLMAAYETAGLRRVEHRFYPGGRHEIFNETNRDEVTADLVAWLDGVLPAA